MPHGTTTLTDAELDALLKAWKRKGAERVFTAVFLASIPLAVFGGLASNSIPPGNLVLICATYYCAICGFASWSADH